MGVQFSKAEHPIDLDVFEKFGVSVWSDQRRLYGGQPPEEISITCSENGEHQGCVVFTYKNGSLDICHINGATSEVMRQLAVYASTGLEILRCAVCAVMLDFLPGRYGCTIDITEFSNSNLEDRPEYLALKAIGEDWKMRFSYREPIPGDSTRARMVMFPKFQYSAKKTVPVPEPQSSHSV